jgi:hypothetical protein
MTASSKAGQMGTERDVMGNVAVECRVDAGPRVVGSGKVVFVDGRLIGWI